MPDCKEIERSIITTYRRRLWTPFVRAIREYRLLKEGDRVCVCISGGKDSMLTAKLFQELKRHSDYDFGLEFLVMDPGYSEENRKKIEENLARLEIPAVIRPTNIFTVADAQKEGSPCYLCARMRRGALYTLARELGCNKIALGHHYDDVIETVMMSILHSGSFQTMLPKLRSTNFEGMELIRPLYFVRERDVQNWMRACGLQFIRCACRFTEKNTCEDGNSQRYQTKLLIRELAKTDPLIEKNIFAAASNVNLDKVAGYRKAGIRYTFNDLYGEE